MDESDKNQHMGLLFQAGFSFQGHSFQCLFSRETDGTDEDRNVRYKAVILNEDHVDAREFLDMFLTSAGAGTLPSLPVTLPSLDAFMVLHEEKEKPAAGQGTAEISQDTGLTRIHIGLGSGGRPLGNLDFCLRNKRLAFLLKLAAPIQLSKIPLAEEIFKEEDGISKIIIAWIQGKEGEGSRLGISFCVTIGNWRQEFFFGCLEQQEGGQNTKLTDKPDSATSKSKNNRSKAENIVLGLLEQKQQTTQKNTKESEPGTNREAPAAGQSKPQKVEKKKGPFVIRDIGVEFQTPEGEELTVFLKFTVLLSFSVLDLQMTGLKFGLPLKSLTTFKAEELKKLKFDMEGLAVDFQNKGLMISGALRKVNSSYSGALRIKYKTFELSAVGAYEKLPDGSHSLFIWLLVRYPLGGPPAFFITGLAAGFGLNRRLKVPSIGEVKNFPLVAMARGNMSAAGKPAPGAGAILDLLSPYLTPESGSYFIALGVEFTTFELLRTFALGIVTFGTDLEIHLLGVTTLSIPPGAGRPMVYAELFLKASILPGKGVLSVEGQLSGESYLFDQNSKLTGGFAMYMWFGENPHAGDFVVTIGGYHPRFQVPAHYPTVDRVGIRWMILPQLTLEGGAYFALTPVGIMAGGNLSILYQWGNLNAWFIANADFLIQWAPLHYDIFVQVSIGVSYTFRIFGFRKTLRVELGAALHLYGPEFAGEVSISWFIISFTIKFGQRNPVMPRLSWQEFKAKFLNNPQKFRVLEGMKPRDGDEGKKGKESVKGQEEIPILDGKQLALIFQSKIPMTEVSLEGKKLSMPTGSKTNFGILPMGEDSKLRNQVQITLSKLEQGIYKSCADSENLTGVLKTESVPPAMWGLKTPPINGNALLSGAVTVLEIRLCTKALQLHYYKESVLMANQVIHKKANLTAPYYEERKEDPGRNLAAALEKWEKERNMNIEEQLIQFEKKKAQMTEALGTLFPLWGKEEQSRDIYTRRETIFLVEPMVRTFS